MCNMRSKVVLFTLLFYVINPSNGQEEVTKSPKKGLVIPYWPQHRCGDFDAFTTVSWYYNYHTLKDPWELGEDYLPKWCYCADEPWVEPKNRSLCFPSDPEVYFVPMIYSVEPYGNRERPEYYEYPPLEEWMGQLIGFNEPNGDGPGAMPPEFAAEQWRRLQDEYPDKVSWRLDGCQLQ